MKDEKDFIVIKGYSNYSINKNGAIINNKTNNIMRPYLHLGYPRLGLYNDNGIRKNMFVHRLVAITFIENKNPKEFNIVNHKDENPLNCRYDNLEWCNQKYNSNYGNAPLKCSLANRRGKHHNAKKVMCNGIIFDCVKDCEEYYGLKDGGMKDWLLGRVNMPSKFYNMELRYLKSNKKYKEQKLKNIKILYNEVEYPSIRAFCNEYNIDRHLVSDWAKGIKKINREYKEIMFLT